MLKYQKYLQKFQDIKLQNLIMPLDKIHKGFMMENKYISVSALNRYLEYRFNNDKHLQLAYIKAEISNIRISNGIMYFH